MPEPSAPQLVEVLVVGAGFAGLAMAIALREQGAALGLGAGDVVVLEREPDIGGTWLVNRYPGCACDVPSHLYSYSFARNAHWSRSYASQPEILAYIRDVAERAGVRPMIRTGCAVASIRWQPALGRWHVACADGSSYHARFVVSATGGLSRPQFPSLPGLRDFAGVTMHSALWDHSVALDGKRIAVIGTGASAIQLVPQLAGRAARLDVYQRTPPWILPRMDGPIAQVSQRAMAAVPLLGWLRREVLRWRHDVRSVAFVRIPGLLRLLQALGERHLRRAIADPTLRAAVTPDYTMGCKRILVADDYYPALQRPNVALHVGGATGVRPEGVVDAQGAVHPADVLVLATGFAATRPLPDGVLFDRDGQDVAAAWGDCPQAYRGTLVHGCPNFFMLVGPNTGLGHSSMLLMIEAQVRYVMALLRRVRPTPGAALEVRADAQERYNVWIQARLAKTIWATGCRSWYLSADGRNPTLWPGSTWAFERSLARPDWQDLTITQGP